MLTAGHGAEPIMIDTTPPVAGYVLDGDTHLQDMTYQPYDDRMCVQWYEWFDAESGIDRFVPSLNLQSIIGNMFVFLQVLVGCWHIAKLN